MFSAHMFMHLLLVVPVFVAANNTPTSKDLVVMSHPSNHDDNDGTLGINRGGVYRFFFAKVISRYENLTFEDLDAWNDLLPLDELEKSRWDGIRWDSKSPTRTLKLTASLPLKIGIPNRKGSYSNHPFLRAMLVSGRVKERC